MVVFSAPDRMANSAVGLLSACGCRLPMELAEGQPGSDTTRDKIGVPKPGPSLPDHLSVTLLN